METYKLQNLKPEKTALILQRESLISGIQKQKDKIDNGQILRPIILPAFYKTFEPAAAKRLWDRFESVYTTSLYRRNRIACEMDSALIDV